MATESPRPEARMRGPSNEHPRQGRHRIGKIDVLVLIPVEEQCVAPVVKTAGAAGQSLISEPEEKKQQREGIDDIDASILIDVEAHLRAAKNHLARPRCTGTQKTRH